MSQVPEMKEKKSYAKGGLSKMEKTKGVCCEEGGPRKKNTKRS